MASNTREAQLRNRPLPSPSAKQKSQNTSFYPTHNNPFDDHRDSMVPLEDPLTIHVEKKNSPNSSSSENLHNSHGSFSSNDDSYSTEPVQLTAHCEACGVPILYSPVENGEALVKCYNCPNINSFGGPGFDESNGPLSPRSAEAKAKIGKQFMGAFKTVKDKTSQGAQQIKKSKFVQASIEKTQNAAVAAKSGAQKAANTTYIAAKKAGNATKNVAMKAGDASKEAAMRALSRSEMEETPHNRPTLAPEPPVNEQTRIFGVDLEAAVQKSSSLYPGVPDVVSKCILYLHEKGLKEEGIFRISGSAQTIKEYKHAFDRGENPTLNSIMDQHVVAGLLKQYFRDLPDPLFTHALLHELSSIEKMSIEDMLPRIQPILDQLPKTNYDILKWLIGLLVEVNKHEGVNKMSVTNLAIVFAPTLGCPMEVIGPIIRHHDQVFM